MHAQALFTIAFAAVLLGERPTPREWLGSLLALAGLALIALTIGGDLAPLGFALTLLSPVSFGLGNVLLKRLGTADMPSLIAWLSLVPPLPALALSAALDGFDGLPRALARAAWPGLAAALYLGLVFGERFGSLRLAGMALVLAGLAVIVAPGARPGVGRSRGPGLLWHRGVRPARASDGKERR